MRFRWLLLVFLVAWPALAQGQAATGFVLLSDSGGSLRPLPSGLFLQPGARPSTAWAPLSLDEGVWTLRFELRSPQPGQVQVTFLEQRVTLATGPEPSVHALTASWRGAGGMAFHSQEPLRVSDLTMIRLPFDTAAGPIEPPPGLQEGLSVFKMTLTGDLPEGTAARFQMAGRPAEVASVQKGLKWQERVRPDGIFAVRGTGLLEWEVVDDQGAVLHAGGRLRLPWRGPDRSGAVVTEVAGDEALARSLGVGLFGGEIVEAMPPPGQGEPAVAPQPSGAVALPLRAVATWLDWWALQAEPGTRLRLAQRVSPQRPWHPGPIDMEEVRMLDWLALHHGARGIVYFGQDPEPAVVEGLKRLITERGQLAPYLAEPGIPLPTVSGLDAVLWRRPEASLLSIVNLTEHRVQGGLRLGDQVGKVWRLPEGAPFEPGEILSVDLAAHEVTLYVLEPR